MGGPSCAFRSRPAAVREDIAAFHPPGVPRASVENTIAAGLGKNTIDDNRLAKDGSHCCDSSRLHALAQLQQAEAVLDR